MSGTKIVCNLNSGGTDSNVINKLIKHGADIRNRSNLHVNVYIRDDAAIVSSANASTYGLHVK